MLSGGTTWLCGVEMATQMEKLKAELEAIQLWEKRNAEDSAASIGHHGRYAREFRKMQITAQLQELVRQN
jgi:hypothetical protein